MTSLFLISEYLSGEYYAKLGDEFEVLSEHLPPADDISELEEYLPAVDGLKRKRQLSVWYAQMEEYWYAQMAMKDSPLRDCLYIDPETQDPELNESNLLGLAQYRMWVARDMELISDERILQQKVRALLGFMKKEVTGRYEDRKRLTHQDYEDRKRLTHQDEGFGEAPSTLTFLPRGSMKTLSSSTNIRVRKRAHSPRSHPRPRTRG